MLGDTMFEGKLPTKYVKGYQVVTAPIKGFKKIETMEFKLYFVNVKENEQEDLRLCVRKFFSDMSEINKVSKQRKSKIV